MIGWHGRLRSLLCSPALSQVPSEGLPLPAPPALEFVRLSLLVPRSQEGVERHWNQHTDVDTGHNHPIYFTYSRFLALPNSFSFRMQISPES